MGRQTRKTVPFPTTLSTSIRPWCFSMIPYDKESPRPVPLPTGLVVMCQTERSQLGNRMKAMTMLRSKLYEDKVREQEAAVAAQRKSQVSSGDRSAKIRTYNYAQSRVTDHRIEFSVHNLPQVMNGDLHQIIDALQLAERTEKLKAEAGI